MPALPRSQEGASGRMPAWIVEWTTRSSYEPAAGGVRRLRFESEEREPTPSSKS
jgi:hypothetical protein